jgi:3-deoxy-manno-octulosonate cytidylyltransferase (CMP-KDO synthetase)
MKSKLLQDLGGMTILQRTYKQAVKAEMGEVVVAVDHPEMQEIAEGFGAKVVMTATTHRSGTERLAECVDKLGLEADDIIVNLQADEPFLPPKLIKQLINNLDTRSEVKMATLCEPLVDRDELFDPNNVKVIMNKEGFAAYFSRAVIPWYRNGFREDPKVLPEEFGYYRHIGLYAYRAAFVKQYVAWEPSPWEQIESLEQLRVLWHGEKIHVDVASEFSGIGIDTEEDLAKARKLFNLG